MTKPSAALTAWCVLCWAVPAVAENRPEKAAVPPASAEEAGEATVPPRAEPAPSGAGTAQTAASPEGASAARPEGASAPTESAPAPSPTPAAPEAPASTAPAPGAAPPVEGPPPIRPARDTLGGHLAVGASVGVVVPFGSVDSGTAESDVVGPGLFLSGDIAYGVSRTVMLGAYGEVEMPSTRGAFSQESASVVAAGPLVRYHLVQGPRFDPWLAYGAGFRRQSFGRVAFTGLDWARLTMGGDWYAASSLGFGPVLELTLGTFLGASEGSLPTKAVNATFVVGGRIVFDSPGK